MPSYTKGPWTFDNKWYVSAPDDEAVSELRTTYRSKREVMANGHLIAAAPDLLQLAIYTLRHSRQIGGLGGVPGLEGYFHLVISQALGGPIEPSKEREEFVNKVLGGIE